MIEVVMLPQCLCNVYADVYADVYDFIPCD